MIQPKKKKINNKKNERIRSVRFSWLFVASHYKSKHVLFVYNKPVFDGIETFARRLTNVPITIFDMRPNP